jgi:prepilin-type processing-associated H-X9-DG protein
MHHRAGPAGFVTRQGVSLLEVLVALIVIVTLMAISIPSLFTARGASYRAACMTNQRVIGQAWAHYVEDYGAFPYVPVDPAWRWGGNLVANITGRLSLDTDRPLNRYLAGAGAANAAHLFCCPADRGIVGELEITGTGRRTACESFGTSYRANTWLLDARHTGLDDELRPLKRSEVITSPSRLVVMGDAFWYEVLESTGRRADWHGEAHTGNLLFLDGSVHTRPVSPRSQAGQAVFDPVDPRATALPPITSEDVRRDERSQDND